MTARSRLALVQVLTLVVVAGCASASPSGSATSAPGGSGSASPGASGSGSPGAPDASAIGLAFVQALSRGDAAGAEAMTDEKMRAAAPAAALAQLWQGFVGQYGAFRDARAGIVSSQPPYTIAAIETTFANATLTLTVAVDAAGRVAGFHIAGVAAPSSGAGWSAPPYADPARFTEQDVVVGRAPWALPGTLSIPNGAGPFPGVVLVQGSGPNDRDETIGPNKPLRDLAWGLASTGIAVLRYDKRTYVYPSAMQALVDTITVKEETIDDALAAIDLLRGTSKVDASRVFLAGHSLGGYLAPRIGRASNGALRGLVLLEANSTPLPRLILAQVTYLDSLAGSPSPSDDAQLAALRAQVARAESPDLTAATPAAELPLGVPASYWLDLRAYDPLATAAALSLPMSLVQGGRDYQVPPGELAAWQRALAGRTDVTSKVYPALDHLLFPGSGPSTPAEYAVPGQHVDPQLIADLAAWIAGR